MCLEKMSQLDHGGCKKRRRGERVYKFKAFCEPGYPMEFKGTFRENVRALLEVGHIESGLCNPMACWSFQLEVHRQPLLHVFLFVVEEPIQLSPNRCCKHCQYIGWGNHLICNKKYHFVLPSKDTVSSCLSFEGRSNISSEETSSKSNLIELQGHIMHGVFHSNGYGHLLCINGCENGSGLAGFQIMDFWDRLCTGLRVREVSLRDTSQKSGMELRLLHAVAYGKPWFGHWGYIIGGGSFGVNQLMYKKAIELLQNVPLGLIAHQLGNSNSNSESLTTISRYQMLSDHSLPTLSNIFHFMLELKGRLPKESSKDSSHPGLLMDASCRWSPKRVEMAVRVIIEALKRAEFRWISRQEVRDAARVYIGDTGLLDFVLKSLGNHIVGKYLVRRCLNPVTKVLEYCLEDISHVLPKQDFYRLDDSKLRPQHKITWAQLWKDIFRLYKHILKDKDNNPIAASNAILAQIPAATTIILDTKFLFKVYSSEHANLDKQHLRCSVVIVRNNDLGSFRKVIAPHECFALESNTTFDELRLKVERTFRDLYWGMRSLVVRSLAGSEATGPDFVSMFYKGGDGVEFEGEISGEIADFGGMFENSDQRNVVVDCPCGTKSEDGERMVCCDICEVWQHTRCVKIPNHEAIPSIFLCSSCDQDILHFPSLP